MSQFTPKQHKLILTELAATEKAMDQVLFARGDDDDDSPYLKPAVAGASVGAAGVGTYYGAKALAAKGKRLNTMPTAVQKNSLVPWTPESSQVLSGPESSGADRFTMIPGQARVTNTVAQPGASKGFFGDLATGGKRVAKDAGESITDAFERLLGKFGSKAAKVV